MTALRGAKRPKPVEGGAADGVSGQSSGMHLVGHGIVLNRETPVSAEEESYEKARRILIYRDMIERTGSIQWHLLAVWPYQPTHGEVVKAPTEAGKKKRKGKFGRARCDSCHYAWFPRSEDFRACPRCGRWKITREEGSLGCMDAASSLDEDDD